MGLLMEEVGVEGTDVVVLVVDTVVVVVVGCSGVLGVFLHSLSNRQRPTQQTRVRTLLNKISLLIQKNLFLTIINLPFLSILLAYSLNK